MSATPEQQRGAKMERRRVAAFLRSLETGRSVKAAASAAGPSVRSFYRLRDRDKSFAEAWARSYEIGTDALREEARRRAVDGWDEPVFQGGKQVGSVRKFDSNLLLAELKRRDPSYRDRDVSRVEVSGTVEVSNPRFDAALERFTAQIRQLAAHHAASSAPLELERGDDA